MAHARRPHARLGQPVVEPGRRAVAEVGADRLVDRREHLQQDEDDADDRERPTSGSPRCTAPTSTPIAMAKTAGRTPRSTRTAHHRQASGPSAFGRTAKNFHSLRARDVGTRANCAPAAAAVAWTNLTCSTAGQLWLRLLQLPNRNERRGGPEIPPAIDQRRRREHRFAELVHMTQLERAARRDHERLAIVVGEEDLARSRRSGDDEKPSRRSPPSRPWKSSVPLFAS